MKFKIYGVSRESGKDVEIVLEGDTKEAAEKSAYELNILVYAKKTQKVSEVVVNQPPVIVDQTAKRFSRVGGTHVQVIEQTAKRYKMAILIGGAMSYLGIAGLLFNLVGSNLQFRVPTLLIFGLIGFGLFIYFGARLLAWWNHG